MWNDGDRQAVLAGALGNDARERRERDAANDRRRNAEVFERDRVTRGPRGRRPSVADARNHGVR
jgi:hypothetical protein